MSDAYGNESDASASGCEKIIVIEQNPLEAKKLKLEVEVLELKKKKMQDIPLQTTKLKLEIDVLELKNKKIKLEIMELENRLQAPIRY